MTPQENNILIAEFMGYENIKNPKEHPIYKIPQFAYEVNDYGSITEVNTFSLSNSFLSIFSFRYGFIMLLFYVLFSP